MEKPEDFLAKWHLSFIIPKEWSLIRRWGDGYALQSKGLRVIIDATIKEDGKAWVHLSVSRKDGIPSHQDLVKVKNTFIGTDKYAYFIFPPESKYVNLHPNCLHLWSLLDINDGCVLPEFSSILPDIGRSI